MKNNSILYMAPKSKFPVLERISNTMPGETIFISPVFVRKLTDEQFKEFCAMKSDFKVNEKAARVIHERMEELKIEYSIDYKNKTLKT